MTNKEIIKALAIHINGKYNCHGCPYMAYNDCLDKIVTDSLDLINRQQAEIEICAEVIKRQDKEIDELNKFANERLDKFTERYDRNLKAEAIWDFADRILSYVDCGHLRPPTEICFSDLDVRQIVEKIAKEMICAENG